MGSVLGKVKDAFKVVRDAISSLATLFAEAMSRLVREWPKNVGREKPVPSAENESRKKDAYAD